MGTGVRELEPFVREALMRGCSRQDIATALQAAGWAPVQVQEALGAFAEVSFAVPVPRPRSYLSAREAFLYLVLFTTLYLSAFHFGALLFELINRAFPDPAAHQALELGPAIRSSVATILAAFPVFLWLSWRIAGELERRPLMRQSAVRRWLTYLTLFVASVALLCDLIALIYNVLGGELTIRFALKVAVVATIAGTGLGYYLRDLRADESA